MPRLPAIKSREDLPPEAHDAFDYVVETRGYARAPFNVLLRSPETAKRIAHLGTGMSGLSVPRHWLRLAVLASIRETDCHYEWGVWTHQPLEEGLRAEAVEAIATKAPLASFTPPEQTIVGLVRELLRDHWVTQPTFDAAREVLGDRGLVEVVAAMGYYNMLALALNCFEIEPLPQFPTPPWKI